jgi:hypothetical protein
MAGALLPSLSIKREVCPAAVSGAVANGQDDQAFSSSIRLTVLALAPEREINFSVCAGDTRC